MKSLSCAGQAKSSVVAKSAIQSVKRAIPAGSATRTNSGAACGRIVASRRSRLSKTPARAALDLPARRTLLAASPRLNRARSSSVTELSLAAVKTHALLGCLPKPSHWGAPVRVAHRSACLTLGPLECPQRTHLPTQRGATNMKRWRQCC